MKKEIGISARSRKTLGCLDVFRLKIFIAVLSIFVLVTLPLHSDNRIYFPKNKFSINLLEGESDESYFVVSMFLPPKNYFASNINVLVQPYSGTMESYISLSIKQFRETNFEIIKEKRIDKNDVVLEYSGPWEQFEAYGYARAVKSGNRVYLITAVALAEEWPNVSKQLIAGVHSFRVEDNKTSPEASWRDSKKVPFGSEDHENSIFSDLVRYTQNESYQFSTRGHRKSLGVELTISIPANWEKEEGQRPHIVQNFTSKPYDDFKMASCIINISKVPVNLSFFSEDDFADVMFSDEVVSESLPQGGEILSTKRTKYDAQPGLFITYIASVERAGFDRKMYAAEHRFIYQGRYVVITCAYNGTHESFKVVGIENEMEAFQLLSQTIANSLVIDKW